jgi:hypothetical protein
MVGTASLGLAAPYALPGLFAFAGEQPSAAADRVRFAQGVEPLVRLIEETPRERCVPALVEELRQGLSYRRFLAAVFFAAVRRQNSHHQMYKIHSVNQVCIDLPTEERILPLFWAMDSYKAIQERSEPAPPPLPELKGPLPSADKAVAEFHDAMQRADVDRAERALVALVRSQGARQVLESLWPYACCNGNYGGHRAIAAANACRAVDTIGWHQAEPVLRFLVREWEGAKEDTFFPLNRARVDKHLEQLPAGWTGGAADRAATLELFTVMREGKGDQAACDLVCQQLRAGVGARAIWDAVFLATAELLVRFDSGWGLASRPLHSNTSTNARHFIFQASGSPRTRLLVLLQAVAWVAHNTRAHVGKDLRDIRLTDLPAASVPAKTEDAVTEIFALLPNRHYYWDDKAKKAVLTYGKREAADEACRKVFVLTKDRPETIPAFAQAARSWLCRKASGDSHDYKILAAMLENADVVSPEWRPHLLAAAVHYFHGNQSIDYPAVQQAREALQKKG